MFNIFNYPESFFITHPKFMGSLEHDFKEGSEIKTNDNHLGKIIDLYEDEAIVRYLDSSTESLTLDQISNIDHLTYNNAKIRLQSAYNALYKLTEVLPKRIFRFWKIISSGDKYILKASSDKNSINIRKDTNDDFYYFSAIVTPTRRLIFDEVKFPRERELIMFLNKFSTTFNEKGNLFFFNKKGNEAESIIEFFPRLNIKSINERIIKNSIKKIYHL